MRWSRNSASLMASWRERYTLTVCLGVGVDQRVAVLQGASRRDDGVALGWLLGLALGATVVGVSMLRMA